ncbi:hypothetical protein ABFX02_14G131200 [Erythranthe guttata]
MDRYRAHILKSFKISPMSPGMNNWKLECRGSSGHDDMMHLDSDSGYSPVHINGQGKGLQEYTKHAEVECPVINVGETEEISTSNRVKALNTFKAILVEYLKTLINPYLKEKKIDRDLYKVIVRKSADKIIKSFGNKNFPTERKINLYIKCSRSKLVKLIEEYVRKYSKN